MGESPRVFTSWLLLLPIFFGENVKEKYHLIKLNGWEEIPKDELMPIPTNEEEPHYEYHSKANKCPNCGTNSLDVLADGFADIYSTKFKCTYCGISDKVSNQDGVGSWKNKSKDNYCCFPMYVEFKI